MKIENFLKLVQAATGREFDLALNEKVQSDEIKLDNPNYIVVRKGSETKYLITFNWKTPKKEENLLKSFITAFCSKYYEANPEKLPSWDKEGRFKHQRAAYTKEELFAQVQENFRSSNMQATLMRYGFYDTNYGIGIFVIFSPEATEAVKSMKAYLKKKGIPFKNEFSDAGWVYRFKIGLDKSLHQSIIQGFHKA